MIYSNFHTHTSLCRHAFGTPREYVESAVKAGLKTLGFSDHAPYMFDGRYYSTFRMYLSDTENYVKTVLDLKREYRNDVKIYLGFEMEYYPRYFEKTFNFLKEFSPDYFLLAQHCTKNEHDGVYAGDGNQSKERVDDYAEQIIEALKTGCFSYLAHPDMLAAISDGEYYDGRMRDICLTAKKLDIPLEFNFLGFAEGRIYPSKRFFKIASECGNTVIYGVDAHTPAAFERCVKISEEADRFLSEFNLKRTENIKLLNGKTV